MRNEANAFLIIFELLSVVVVVPRRLRLRFWLMRPAKWLVPAARCLALPLADRRKRFLVPLCVFCLGIGLCFSILLLLKLFPEKSLPSEAFAEVTQIKVSRPAKPHIVASLIGKKTHVYPAINAVFGSFVAQSLQIRLPALFDHPFSQSPRTMLGCVVKEIAK